MSGGRLRLGGEAAARASWEVAGPWYLIGKGIEACAHGVAAAELGGLEAADDVLEGGGHYEVLLLQTQLLALKELGTVQGRPEQVVGVGAGVARRLPARAETLEA